jgi:D-alanine transaminase
MPRIAYVNGRYVPHGAAVVHIEDRGYQFADGVYEVVPIDRGNLVDEEPHLDRLDYSLGELRIEAPMSRRALKMILREVIRRNGVRQGLVYMQVTRGVAPRDHKFPKSSQSALVVTTKRLKPLPATMLEDGVSVITVPDIRWKRRDIKSISLLPNILAKQQAAEQGAYEAWQIDETGHITEGASTNAWIVTKAGEIVTRPRGHDILSGITRLAVLDLVAEGKLKLAERGFTLEELHAAGEAFLTGSSIYVVPVTRVDGRPIGNGKPGPIARRLRELFMARLERA